VCIDRLPRRWQGDSVTVANEQGAHAATKRLIDPGHQDIAIITGPLHLTNAEQHRRGCRRAMTEAALPVTPEFMQQSPFDLRGGRSRAVLLLRMLPRPTAIFAGNDMIAMGAIQAIRDLGLRCPEDVSVMGFDDPDFAALINPAGNGRGDPSPEQIMKRFNL
jgi:DNA-binding LacI/PurR family transcriptional regulator